ncbi:MAG: DUF4124 domain-containing protein [Pseudomonadales bacterium]|nr:DUF4124 domain-containing protein [Pseudomonadales bacterium]
MKKTMVFILSMLVVEAVCGEIYKWVDDSGKVNFGDHKAEEGKAEEVTVEINTYTNVTYDISIFDYGHQKVVMYSTEWCSYCKKAKKYFKDNEISFVEYDIEKSSRARNRYDKMGATGIPVIIVGKKRMNGFNVKGFEKIYQ